MELRRLGRQKSKRGLIRESSVILEFLSPVQGTVTLCRSESSGMEVLDKTLDVSSPGVEGRQKRPVYLDGLVIGYETVRPEELETTMEENDKPVSKVILDGTIDLCEDTDEPELVQIEESIGVDNGWEESSVALSPPHENEEEEEEQPIRTILWRPPSPSLCFKICNVCGDHLEEREKASTYIQLKNSFHCLTCNNTFTKIQLAKHRTACFLTKHEFNSPDEGYDPDNEDSQRPGNSKNKFRMVACGKCVDTIKTLAK